MSSLEQAMLTVMLAIVKRWKCAAALLHQIMTHHTTSVMNVGASSSTLTSLSPFHVQFKPLFAVPCVNNVTSSCRLPGVHLLALPLICQVCCECGMLVGWLNFIINIYYIDYWIVIIIIIYCAQMNAIKVSKRLTKKPRQPVQLAADVAERALATGGENYLETRQQRLSWWQLSLLDVYSLLTLSATAMVGLAALLLKMAFGH